MPLKLDITSDRFRPEIESNLYFVVAEALTNMSKHARAQSGTVTIRAEQHILHVEVRDDGVGGADVDGGGLRGMPTASPRSEAACGSRVLRAAARGSLPSSRWSGERPGRRAPI